MINLPGDDQMGKFKTDILPQNIKKEEFVKHSLSIMTLHGMFKMKHNTVEKEDKKRST